MPVPGTAHEGWTACGEPARTAHVARATGKCEWYSPAAYVDAAREVMGGIDLDPASSATANEVVGASIYYTAMGNGLMQPWKGRVWMNPPYANSLITRFAARLVCAIDSGDVSEAITLTNNATETGWFVILTSRARAICFPRGRVKFWRPGCESAAPLQGQALAYFGPQPGKFMDVFAAFGMVASVHPMCRDDTGQLFTALPPGATHPKGDSPCTTQPNPQSSPA